MMSFVNKVNIVNEECCDLNRGVIVASTTSPGIINICETSPSPDCINKGTTYIRVYNDGK